MKHELQTVAKQKKTQKKRTLTHTEPNRTNFVVVVFVRLKRLIQFFQERRVKMFGVS